MTDGNVCLLALFLIIWLTDWLTGWLAGSLELLCSVQPVTKVGKVVGAVSLRRVRWEMVDQVLFGLFTLVFSTIQGSGRSLHPYSTCLHTLALSRLEPFSTASTVAARRVQDEVWLGCLVMFQALSSLKTSSSPSTSPPSHTSRDGEKAAAGMGEKVRISPDPGLARSNKLRSRSAPKTRPGRPRSESRSLGKPLGGTGKKEMELPPSIHASTACPITYIFVSPMQEEPELERTNERSNGGTKEPRDRETWRACCNRGPLRLRPWGFDGDGGNWTESQSTAAIKSDSHHVWETQRVSVRTPDEYEHVPWASRRDDMDDCVDEHDLVWKKETQLSWKRGRKR